MTAGPEEERRRLRSLLVIACLFTAVGGYMDAYSYLAHGHVFANAQTGKMVFFAVYASGGQWTEAARHVPPIAAFALGVAVAKLLGVRSEKRSFRATLLCEGFELLILTAISLFGNTLPDAWIVPTISFVAAIQNTSLDKVGRWSFNSAMTTGNLRDVSSGLVLWMMGCDVAENRERAIALGLICCSFVAGGLLGGSYTRVYGKYALGPCIALVAVGIFLTWRERRKRLR